MDKKKQKVQYNGYRLIYEGRFIKDSNFKSIRLRWNRFKVTIKDYKFYFEWNVVVKSNDLGLFRIRNGRLIRLELMKYLSDIGYSNREISDFLNISNIKKVRTNDMYKPKDIWVGLKKYQKRLDRVKNNKIISITERLLVNHLPNL